MGSEYVALPADVYATIPNWFRFRYLGEVPPRVAKYCRFVQRVKAKWPHRYDAMVKDATERSK